MYKHDFVCGLFIVNSLIYIKYVKRILKELWVEFVLIWFFVGSVQFCRVFLIYWCVGGVKCRSFQINKPVYMCQVESDLFVSFLGELWS